MFKGIRRASRALALLTLVAGAASCREVNTSEQDLTITDLLTDQSTAHATFVNGLSATGVTQTLEDGGSYTVFAPTNAAFAALPAAKWQEIQNDPAKLNAVIRNHVVAGREPASRLDNGRQLTTLAGSQVTITRTGSAIQYGNATVTLDNLGAANGVLHVIDQVVLPPGI